jgi:hypothetical protein
VNYFLPEIKDELVGHIPAEDIEQGFALLGRMARSTFSPFALYALAQRVEVSLHPNFLSLLFEFGALGNIIQVSPTQSHYTYRYRNPHSPFNPDRKVSIHRGLLPALNIPAYL